MTGNKRATATHLPQPSQALLVIGCTALGLVLRLGQLGYSYSADDFTNLHGIGGPTISSVIAFVTSPGVPYPPFYWVMLHFWGKLADGESLMRIPSVVFGVLTIPMTWLLGKQLFDKRVGIVGALLIAVSPFMIEQSSQIKPHTLMALLTLLLTFFMVNWIRTNQVMPYLAGYTIFGIISLYTHYHMALIILALNIFALCYLWKKRPDRLGAWIISQVLVAIAFLPWVPFVLQQITAGVSPTNPLSAFPELAITFSTGYTAIAFSSLSLDKVPSLDMVRDNLGILLVLVPVYSTGTVIGITKSMRARYNGWLILLGFFAPVLLAFAYAFKVSGANSPKYLIGASIFYYLILALAVTESPQRRLGLGLLAAMLLLSSYSLFNYYFREVEFGRKADWRGLAQYITVRSQSDDVVVTAESHAFQWYYHGGLPVASFFYMPVGSSVEAEFERAARTLGTHSRVWFAESTRASPDPATPQRVALNWLRTHYMQVAQVRFNPTLVLYLFERSSP